MSSPDPAGAVPARSGGASRASGPSSTRDPHRSRANFAATWPLWILIAIAATELLGNALIRARVPPDADWESAAAHVRDHWEEGDEVVAAPDWADPLLRLHMGDRVSIAMAGPADLAPFERLWELSIRGHRSAWAPEREPDEHLRFGRVTVKRWDLGASPVLYDLTSHLSDASVDVDGRACVWRRLQQHGGGLFHGALEPAEGFFCGPNPWLWVGETVLEDLDLMPRQCIWQHPQAGDVPTTTTYRDVLLGDRIVLHAGLYYDHERRLEHGPVTVQILVDGVEVGRMVHRDGDGFKRTEADPDPLNTGKERGDVSIVVMAPDPDLRTVCWAASTRQGERP